jgi:hypothetical protein
VLLHTKLSVVCPASKVVNDGTCHVELHPELIKESQAFNSPCWVLEIMVGKEDVEVFVFVDLVVDIGVVVCVTLVEDDSRVRVL